jgi:hypothetical protein
MLEENKKEYSDSDPCQVCKVLFSEDNKAAECHRCKTWTHKKCSGISQGEFDTLTRKTARCYGSAMNANERTSR